MTCGGSEYLCPLKDRNETDSLRADIGMESLDSFMKKITVQNITQEGIKNLGKTIIEMATAESLEAHANAVRVRLV